MHTVGEKLSLLLLVILLGNLILNLDGRKVPIPANLVCNLFNVLNFSVTGIGL